MRQLRGRGDQIPSSDSAIKIRLAHSSSPIVLDTPIIISIAIIIIKIEIHVNSHRSFAGTPIWKFTYSFPNCCLLSRLIREESYKNKKCNMKWGRENERDHFILYSLDQQQPAKYVCRVRKHIYSPSSKSKYQSITQIINAKSKLIRRPNDNTKLRQHIIITPSF